MTQTMVPETTALALAETLMMAVCQHDIDSIVDRHMPVTWKQGVRFANDGNVYTQRLGYVILLTALVETPGATDRLIRALVSELQGFDDETL